MKAFHCNRAAHLEDLSACAVFLLRPAEALLLPRECLPAQHALCFDGRRTVLRELGQGVGWVFRVWVLKFVV